MEKMRGNEYCGYWVTPSVFIALRTFDCQLGVGVWRPLKTATGWRRNHTLTINKYSEKVDMTFSRLVKL